MQNSIFESIDVERYQQVKRLLVAALDMPAQERDDFLQNECGDDLILRQQVDNLLKIEINDSFMEQGAIAEESGEPMQEELLEEIGRFKVNSLIDSGGMGSVYAGVDQLLERPVAIKFLGRRLRSSPIQRANFLNEAKILSTFQHSNICQVYDFVENDEQDALVMELIEGQQLRHSIRQTSFDNSIDILLQITEALVAAHERGIVHQDLKPENIMLDNNGNVKVLDFGLAQFEETTSDKPTLLSGTPGYMAPERANSEASGSASDLWSLGIIALELFSGKSPFDETLTRDQLIETNRLAEVKLPSSLSNNQRKILQKLLVKDPNQRVSARHLLDLLTQLKNRKKRRLITAIAATALTIACLSFWKYTYDLKIQRDFALQQKEQAESARSDAEDLVSFMMNDLYRELKKVGRLKALNQTANEVLNYYNKATISTNNDPEGTAAFALTRVGEVLSNQSKIEPSITTFKKSARILEELYQQNPENELIAWRLAITYDLLSYSILSSDHMADAKKYNQKSIELSELLTKGLAPGIGPKEHPTAHERWSTLFRGYFLRTDIAVRLGNSKQSLDGLESIIELAYQASQQDPLLRKNLADLYFTQCNQHLELSIKSGVVEACSKVLELDRELHQKDPENYDAYSMYLLDLTTMVQAYTMQERYDEAYAAAREGEFHGNQILKREPDNFVVANNFTNLSVVEGIALSKHGKVAESLIKFRKAEQLTKELLADNSDDLMIINNRFIALAYLGEREEARKLAKQVAKSGLKRRIFFEACDKFEIDTCRPSE